MCFVVKNKILEVHKEWKFRLLGSKSLSFDFLINRAIFNDQEAALSIHFKNK